MPKSRTPRTAFIAPEEVKALSKISFEYDDGRKSDLGTILDEAANVLSYAAVLCEYEENQWDKIINESTKKDYLVPAINSVKEKYQTPEGLYKCRLANKGAVDTFPYLREHVVNPKIARYVLAQMYDIFSEKSGKGPFFREKIVEAYEALELGDIDVYIAQHPHDFPQEGSFVKKTGGEADKRTKRKIR